MDSKKDNEFYSLLDEINKVVKTAKDSTVFGESFDDLLRIFVFKKGKETFGVLRSVAGVYIPVNVDYKINHEINRWINAICKNTPILKQLSPTLYELHRKKDMRALARTVRMLLSLRSLFATNPEDKFGGYSPVQKINELRKVSVQIRPNKKIKLALVIEELKMQHAKHHCSCWHVSLPLLLIVAIAESQCESFRPVFWEGYSAGRARHELQNKWKGLKHCFLDIISLFILYQSAVGQLTRQSGSGTFLETFKNMKIKCFDDVQLENALKVIAILEETRNHEMERYTKIGKFNVNIDCPRKGWDTKLLVLPNPKVINTLVSKKRVTEVKEKLARRQHRVFRTEDGLKKEFAKILGEKPLKKILGNKKHAKSLLKKRMDLTQYTKAIFKNPIKGVSLPKYTWSYASSLSVADQDIREFKRFVERNWHSILDIDKSENIAFSFRRNHINTRILPILSENVQVVATANKKTQEFRKKFYLKIKTIPSCFSRGTRFKIVEVHLNHHIAAETLLFGEIVNRVTAGVGHTSGDLAVHLFKEAKERLALEKDKLQKHNENYVPFPLIQRILDVVHTIRPDDCRLVRITFDEEPPVSIPIPESFSTVNKDDNSVLINCIANYVPAFVLSHAMSKGFHSCEINLNDLSSEQTNKSMLNMIDWDQKIKEAFVQNGYEVLLDKYLRDYNTESKCFQLQEHLGSALKPIPIDRLLNSFAKYKAEHKKEGKEDFIMLGVDIGGTLTKFQFYKLSCNGTGASYKPLGESFRMLTLGTRKSDDNLSRLDVARTALAFARRLVDSIHSNIRLDDELNDDKYEQCLKAGNVRAIGISWPGPVCNHRIAGTSGILRCFQGLSNRIKENLIETIMDLDIVTAFKRAWREKYPKSEEPVVAFENDGNCDGTGAIIDLLKENKRPRLRDIQNLRLAVVKLGTGIAGTVFINGTLSGGLCEWGKMPLDLAAQPNKDFPNGTANAYLSSSALPQLISLQADNIKNGDSRLFGEVKKLDSLELGLLLECGNKNHRALKELCHECGIRQYAREGLGQEFDVEILRRVLEKAKENKRAEPELLAIIQKRIGIYGLSAIKEVNKAVVVHGKLRMDKMLCLQHPGCDGLFHSDPTSEIAEQHLVQARKEVNECAKILGHYLGDFIVSLYDLFQLDAVVLSGGVLSRTTGKEVIKEVNERIGNSINGIALNNANTFAESVKKKTEKAGKVTRKLTLIGPAQKSDRRYDYGTLGVAVLAINEFLIQQKRKGLYEIEGMLHKLGTTNEIQLQIEAEKPDHASIYKIENNKKKKPLSLARYCLEYDEVADYLERQSTVIGFFRVDSLDLPNNKYVKYRRY